MRIMVKCCKKTLGRRVAVMPDTRNCNALVIRIEALRDVGFTLDNGRRC